MFNIFKKKQPTEQEASVIKEAPTVPEEKPQQEDTSSQQSGWGISFSGLKEVIFKDKRVFLTKCTVAGRG